MPDPTLGDLITNIKNDILEPAEDADIKRHVVAALRHLSGERFDFAEVAGASFNTVVSQEVYTQGSGGVPAAIKAIDHIFLTVGTARREIRLLPWDEYRRQRSAVNEPGTPETAAFYAKKLFLFPIPSEIRAVGLDYLTDATLDQTGAEITTSSALTVYNAFFNEGEELVRARAIYTWAMGRGDSETLATRMKLLYNETYSRMTRQHRRSRINGRQAPVHF